MGGAAHIRGGDVNYDGTTKPVNEEISKLRYIHSWQVHPQISMIRLKPFIRTSVNA